MSAVEGTVGLDWWWEEQSFGTGFLEGSLAVEPWLWEDLQQSVCPCDYGHLGQGRDGTECTDSAIKRLTSDSHARASCLSFPSPGISGMFDVCGFYLDCSGP